MTELKPILALDFDGVIHAYTSGWKGAEEIPDGPVPGALNFVHNAVKDWNVVVVSSRAADADGKRAIENWLCVHGFPDLLVTNQKPPAVVTLDDRAILFTGKFPSPSLLRSFQPWYKLTPPTVDQLGITEMELTAAGIHPQTWANSDAWGDREKAFYFEKLYRIEEMRSQERVRLFGKLLNCKPVWSRIENAIYELLAKLEVQAAGGTEAEKGWTPEFPQAPGLYLICKPDGSVKCFEFFGQGDDMEMFEPPSLWHKKEDLAGLGWGFRRVW
jgi:hypothetical protein